MDFNKQRTDITFKNSIASELDFVPIIPVPHCVLVDEAVDISRKHMAENMIKSSTMRDPLTHHEPFVVFVNLVSHATWELCVPIFVL